MRILVTGAAGFAGTHLTRLLRECGYEVVGSDRPGGTSKAGSIPCDISMPKDVASLIEQAAPEAVVHLAAVSLPRAAARDPGAAYRTNVYGTRNLLECTHRFAPDAKFIAISSAAVYGDVPSDEQPIPETHPLAPSGVYAETKAAVEEICAVFADRLKIVVLRPFNHIGPGQSAEFVTSNFARQIALIEAGRSDPIISVGNLDVERDFIDVRDIVQAYRLAIELCPAGDTFNVCSGAAVSIRHVLESLMAMSEADIRVETDPARLRSDDASRLCGRPDKFDDLTGWKRSFDVIQSLTDILDSWRRKIAEA